MKRLFILMAVIGFAACGAQKPLTESQYVQSVRKNVPFAVSEFKLIKPDVYAFSCDHYVSLLPDYEVDNEGVSMIWRTTFGATHTTQPAQYIWRNIVIDKKNCRVLCIDRLLKDNKTFGYVYVLQGETKHIPNGIHWNVTDHRLLLHAAPILEDKVEFSVDLLKTLTD